MSLEFWSKFTEKLESKLTQEEFNTWVRPLKGNLNDKTLEITAPNDFVLNYVMQNLSDEITNTINKEIKGNISLVYKTLDKETFVDKYQSKQACFDWYLSTNVSLSRVLYTRLMFPFISLLMVFVISSERFCIT